MKTRARIFSVLLLLSILWLCGGSSATIDSAQHTAQHPPAEITDAAAYATGAGIGGLIAAAFFTCTGAPMLLLFLWMLIHTRGQIRYAKYYQELIETLKTK